MVRARNAPRTPALLATLAAAAGALFLAGCTGAASPAAARLERAHRLLERHPLIDGHNDVPWQVRERAQNHLAAFDFAAGTAALGPPMHTDLARLRAGRVGAQFWSVFTPAETGGPGAARLVLEQIDVAKRLIARHPEHLELALGAGDIVRIHRQGRVASLLGMEGGHGIENSLALLRQFYAAGVRSMTLTHALNTDWADASTDTPRCHGLAPFGARVVREMNRLGMLVDLSHTSPETMHDVLDVVEAPPIFSHSAARALTDHVRNVPDDVLARLRTTGGVVMVTFVPAFVSEEVRLFEVAHGRDERNGRPRATLEQVLDHIDHVARVAGIEHVGIGSDFDGMDDAPLGLEDVAAYPRLVAGLLERGYSDADVARIAGGNLLSVLRAAEAAARRLAAERAPDDAAIEDVQGTAGD